MTNWIIILILRPIFNITVINVMVILTFLYKNSTFSVWAWYWVSTPVITIINMKCLVRVTFHWRSWWLTRSTAKECESWKMWNIWTHQARCISWDNIQFSSVWFSCYLLRVDIIACVLTHLYHCWNGQIWLVY